MNNNAATSGRVVRRKRLGGVLNYYHREAAAAVKCQLDDLTWAADALGPRAEGTVASAWSLLHLLRAVADPALHALAGQIIEKHLTWICELDRHATTGMLAEIRAFLESR